MKTLLQERTAAKTGTAHDPCVREIMAGDPAWVSPGTSVMDAAALMSRRNIGAVIVVEQQRLVGILSERDLLRAAGRGCKPDAVRVDELMTRAPFIVSADATWTAAADLMVEHSVRHLPVVESGRPVGMLSVRDLMEHRNHHLRALVQERTAELEEKNAALEKRDRTMQFHLDVAGRIQRQFLPPALPEHSSFSFSMVYHPLDKVSGDYYDFAILPSGRLGILVADASGHGVPAAFVSVMAKTAFQAYAQEIESPAGVLQTMNKHLNGLIEAEHFITMFYGVVDPSTLRLQYASAGHPRPLCYRHATRQVEALHADGTMIGFLPEAVFEERILQLQAGDSLLLYTDGVSECRNENKEQFGQARLEEFLHTHGDSPDLITQLEAELARFRGKQPVHDDVTCICLRVQR